MNALPPHLSADPYLPRIVATVRTAMGEVASSALLFGSRAAGRARPGSDYDIALVSECDLASALARAQEALEASTIPFMVDLVDLRTTDAGFRARVLQEGIPLWNG